MYDIYSNARNDRLRFTLGKSGERKLIVIGHNPSTATKERSDTTVAKVQGVAERNGFDGFVMLNLYPVRSTDFNALPQLADGAAFSENLNRIETLVTTERSPVLWAAWGESVLARSYFTDAIRELSTRLAPCEPSWRHFGPLTLSGHPVIPRLQYAWSFSKFDMEQYVQTL
ncbi:DUF1643 domain-containing protein [Candidatus Aalborgicola defluviihabitans]|uniref:DUF1643 domain-containing protein n=1 Tax=Candidatus Aalborgicola defluviihabitans TaxID=3386187 RepID=UPI003908CDBB|nr:DUF1643 domain-containing protein [Burkholderiales bacterium]